MFWPFYAHLFEGLNDGLFWGGFIGDWRVAEKVQKAVFF
jgi:hypothetical protein